MPESYRKPRPSGCVSAQWDEPGQVRAPGAGDGAVAASRATSDSSSVLARRSSCRASGSGPGYCGSMSIRVSAMTAAAQTRVNHLRSAGRTCQGAHSVLVWLSISE